MNDMPPARPAGLAGFLAFQAVLLAAGASWGGYRLLELRADRALPALRAAPLAVEPTYNVPVVVSDEQLARVLRKLEPKFLGAKTKINHVDHGLRCWGVPASFEQPQSFSSAEDLRRLLTDHRRFAEVYGPQVKPLLIDEAHGVRVRVAEGPASSSHVDHTLASLAEVGTPLDFPVHSPRRQTTYRALVEQSLADFDLNQVEYEWSALTYALFLPPARRFRTSDGQEITFDRLAERIMRQDVPQGVCFANHRMHALVVLLRIDAHMPILAPTRREEILAYLRGITARLVKTQHADGSWDGNWPTGSAADDRTSGDKLADRILATGHPLEWWALAPEEVHPPRNVLAAAGQWLVRTIDELSPEKTEDYFTYLSHAARALALWRGKFPHQVPRAAAP